MRPDNITALVFCILLTLLAILLFLLPQSPFSMTEKRSLQTTPTFRFSSVLSGKFSRSVDDWYADQFPVREAFVGVKALVSTVFLQGRNNGILQGENGQLAKCEYGASDRVDLKKLEDSCLSFKTAAEGTGVPYVICLPGRTVDLAASAFFFPETDVEKTVHNALEGVNSADVSTVLREKFENGEPVIFRTDHHWTALGAYYAYCEIMRAFGMDGKIIPQERYEPVLVNGNFHGTYWSAGGMRWVKGEELFFWAGKDDGDYRVTADGKVLDGFYNLSSDGYEVFLDGVHDVVTIEKVGEDRPRLLVLKDSFANALAPFLARHFDLVLLNLSSTRKDFTDVRAQAEEYGADRVLLVYSVANLLITDVAKRIN